MILNLAYFVNNMVQRCHHRSSRNESCVPGLREADVAPIITQERHPGIVVITLMSNRGS